MRGPAAIAARVQAAPRRRRVAFQMAAGAVAATGQAPLGAWPLTLIGLAALFGLFRQARGPRQAAALGWAAATGYFLVALHWLVEPFLVDAARHGWMAPFALVLMAAGLALFWAAAAALARWAGAGAPGFVAALTLAEVARGYFFSGFPWAQPGHVWIDTPVLQWAAFAGAPGLTVLTLAAAAALWHAVAGRRAAGAAGLAGLAALYLAGPLVGAAPEVPDAAPVVRLVQPNAPQHEKWDPARIPVFFDRQLAFTRAGARPDLIVWPETAVPVLLGAAGPVFAAISEASGDVPVVLGLQRRDGARLYNSLVLLGPGGKVDALYDKHHLVPFGEYLPFGWFLKRFGLRGLAADEGGGYSAGPGPQVIGMGDLGRALPLICYEGVFAQDVAAAPGRADFMLLITNDAWFGRFSGPYQHLAQARLRSVEQGLPMIRVANTGVSAVIDARGRITERLPLGQAGWTDAALPPPAAPTLYARIGDGPLVLLLLIGLGAARLLRRPAKSVR